MHYREYTAPAALRHLVRFFWTLEVPAGSSARHYNIVADGCPGIMFHRGGVAYALPSLVPQRLPHLCVYGQSTGPGRLYLQNADLLFGINLYPHGLTMLLGVDARECTDQIWDLGPLAGSLVEQLLNAPTAAAVMGLLTHFLTRQQRQSPDRDCAVESSIRMLVQSRGCLPVMALTQTLQMSERQFQRRFRQQVGVPPKLFARILRFQSALHVMQREAELPLTEIAFASGYADQSHFIRDFRRFGGLTPGDCRHTAYQLLCGHDMDLALP